MSKVDTEKSAFLYVRVLDQPDRDVNKWFRVKTSGHKNDVIQDRGFGHAVSAAPLERFEPEISCMDHQSWFGDGAPLKTLDTETGVSSCVCKSSMPAHQCWEHKAAHDTLGRRNQSSMFHMSFDSALHAFSWAVFYLYLLKSCNPLDIYQEKIILCKDACTSVFLASSGLPWGFRW